MKPARIALILVVAGVIGLLLFQSFSELSTYTDFATAKQTGKEVHIVGEWIERENAGYNPMEDKFEFMLQDSSGFKQRVHYFDPKPVNFESAEKVVVIGKYEEEVFVANKILMKCPSKYEESSISDSSK
jgi:cytochrome c-type biogenesis protein CcmE